MFVRPASPTRTDHRPPIRLEVQRAMPWAYRGKPRGSTSKNLLSPEVTEIDQALSASPVVPALKATTDLPGPLKRHRPTQLRNSATSTTLSKRSGTLSGVTSTTPPLASVTASSLSCSPP